MAAVIIPINLPMAEKMAGKKKPTKPLKPRPIQEEQA